MEHTFRHISVPVFLLNHIGVLIVILCIGFSSVCTEQLTMTLQPHSPQWRAVSGDDEGRTIQLDFALRLNSDTSIDIYRHTTKRWESINIPNIKPQRIDGWSLWKIQNHADRGIVLQLVKDPTLWFAYIGFIIMMVGALLNIIHLWWRKSLAPLFILLLAMGLLATYFITPRNEDNTLPSVLHSIWLIPHIGTYICSYLCAGTAICVMLWAFICKLQKRPYDRLFLITEKCACLALSFMTMGMAFGAFWAQEAWGHYWNWDLKETWAAITWLLFATFIHLCKLHRIQKVVSSAVLVIAFCCMQMCWWGINYLPNAQQRSAHLYHVND
ncbi:MAG: cytochrome c biogenesis protein CcsA [Prevotella sp.]|nr:cytochrome c biogenesis protein CcsA [Candidatus Equicola faecalis]